jgi:hypothetical protein
MTLKVRLLGGSDGGTGSTNKLGFMFCLFHVAPGLGIEHPLAIPAMGLTYDQTVTVLQDTQVSRGLVDLI